MTPAWPTTAAAVLRRPVRRRRPPSARRPAGCSTPAEVAARCGLSYAPSPEQARVVAAPADRPLVVVAGAGSGKTETMAARVSWLVANRLVEPEAILGLTFTRKAASELNERIRLRLGALARHPETEPDLRERLDIAQPTVSTYHGYAAALVAEHGLRIGVEPGAGVLGPAMCWGQAATAVAAYTGDMSDVPLTLLTTVEDVLALAAELGEHDISPAALRAWTARLESQIAGYADAPRKKGPYGPVLEMLARQKARVALLPLVEAFEARKRAAGAIDYADQVAYAARIAVASPEVGRRERARWKVVLLDEYQDTSVGQLRMLEALFGRDTGHPVLAVGDPRQSIYGWRGASAGTIERFDRTFPGLPGPAGRAAHAGHQLAQRRRRARRRQRRLGDAAAARPAAARPRSRRPPPAAGAVTVGPLRHRRRGDRGPGRPAGGLLDRRRPAPARTDGKRPTVAVLVRARKQLPGIAAALRERGLPVEVVGLGGLLEVPEVSDVVATLTVLVDPTAGDALGRLLTGARWRIGPRDLAALEARARALVHSRRPARPAEDGAAPVVEAPTERGSIVEALDDLGGPDAYSPPGYRRLRRLGGELGPPAHPARASRCPTSSTRWPAPWAWRPSWPARRARARPAPAPTSTPCTGSPPSSPSWPSCPRCRPSSATCGTPRSASGAWSRARSRSTPRRCSCSPGTRPRAWSGTSSPSPGMTKDQFPSKTDTSDSWIRDPGTVPAELRLTDREELPAAAPAGARLRRPGGGQGGARRLRAGLEGLRRSPRRSASATSRSPGPGTCCSARAAGGATA